MVLKIDTEDHIMYDPISVRCPEKANLQGEKDSWLTEME